MTQPTNPTIAALTADLRALMEQFRIADLRGDGPLVEWIGERISQQLDCIRMARAGLLEADKEK